MTTIAESRPAAGRSQPAVPGWGPLLVVLTGTFMTMLDFFVVNVALPSIQGGLHAGPAAIQLIIASYGLTFAISMISGGRLGDLYGRRRMFTIGLALFTLTSAACGLAPGIGLLVAGRAMQGAAAALMTPQVLAILGTIYTGQRRGRAFAWYGLAMGFAGVLGQLLGGVIITADVGGSGWRGIFLINLPVGVAALLLTGRMVPESRGDAARLDLAGTVLVTAGLTAVVLPLIEGQQYGWPAWAWASLGVAPVLLAAFAVHQWRRSAGGRAPLVDPGLLRIRAFGVGTLAALTFGLVPASFFFVLALYLQEGRHMSALLSGTVFAAVGVGFFAAMLTATAMAARLGRQILALGSLTVAAGCLLLAAVTAAASWDALLPGLAVTGFGIGMVLVPLSATVLRDVDHRHAGSAAGVLSTAQQVGAALGIAVVGVVFYRALQVTQFAHAMTVSMVLLAALTVVTAGLVQLLPRPAGQHPGMDADIAG